MLAKNVFSVTAVVHFLLLFNFFFSSSFITLLIVRVFLLVTLRSFFFSWVFLNRFLMLSCFRSRNAELCFTHVETIRMLLISRIALNIFFFGKKKPYNYSIYLNLLFSITLRFAWSKWLQQCMNCGQVTDVNKQISIHSLISHCERWKM